MADQGYNIDDPQNLNTFLALIGGSQVPSSSEPSRSTASQQTPSVGLAEPETASNSFKDQDSSESNSRSQSVSPSPAPRIKAPPPTPAAGAVASNTIVETVVPFESLEEDGSDILRTIANTSNLDLNDSIYAPKNYQQSRIAIPNLKYATMPARRGLAMASSKYVAPLGEKEPTESPNKEFEHGKLMTKYEDNVVAKFLEEKSPKAKKEPGSRAEPFPAEKDINVSSTFPETVDKVTQTTIDPQEHGKPTPDNSEKTVSAASADGEVDKDGDEDRENLKQFKTWGTPMPRSRPAARVRKIILNNLPADSDLTLVQSLVYGGAIETFSLAPNKTSAYVTFVRADACDAFFDAHPNGIVFKNPKTRRKHVVYVDKGQDIDVVSGILQAYLDCQASRVIRATGADEDWGMRALYKLAESKNRKVETIVDTYRNEVRTIIFRFTNIVDAVNFRGQLLRDEDWEMCNIQFMDDPVEKATTVHLED